MKKKRLGILGTLALCCCLSAGCAGQSCEQQKTNALTSLFPTDTLYRQMQGFGYQGTYDEFVVLMEKLIKEGVEGVDITRNNELAITLQNGEQMIVGKLNFSGMAQMQSAYEQVQALGYKGSYNEFITLSEDIMTAGIECVFIDANGKVVLFLNNGESVIVGELKRDKDNPAVVENGIQYKLNETGNGYTVVGVENLDAKVVNIPSICQGKPVTTIGNSAFAHMKYLEKVYIGGNVEEIKAGAFYGCDSINSLVIPARVEHISATAFDNSGLKVLYMERNVLPETYKFTSQVKVYFSSQWHYGEQGNPVLN